MDLDKKRKLLERFLINVIGQNMFKNKLKNIVLSDILCN